MNHNQTGKDNHRYSHGYTNHPLYKIFHSIKDRCLNKNTKCYHRYGGRGIVIFREWLNDPASFIRWAISSGWLHGLEIDRRDNDKGYCPENCRFVDHITNSKNRTLLQSNNKTGYCGVTKHGSKFQAAVTHKRKYKYLGLFVTSEAAAFARDKYVIANEIGLPLNFNITGDSYDNRDSNNDPR